MTTDFAFKLPQPREIRAIPPPRRKEAINLNMMAFGYVHKMTADVRAQGNCVPQYVAKSEILK